MQYQHHLHRTAQRNLPRKLPSTSLQVRPCNFLP
jgi:hypothetical protein